MAVKRASDAYRQLSKQVSRMADMANKRLTRLERNDLTMLPAYQAWEQNGSIRFSVKGKDYNQLQSEYWRLKNFLDDRTSTVREANRYLREMAENTGIKYNGLADLKIKSRNFFILAERIKQYNISIGETAAALGYRRIWEQINTMIERGNIDLDAAISDDARLEQFLNAMEQYTPVERGREGYSNNGTPWDFVDI